VADETRCKEMLFRDWHDYHCPKPVWKEKPGDGYCKIHHPDTKAARNKALQARFEASSANWRKRERISAAERAVLDAAERWATFDDIDRDYDQELRFAIDDLRKARK